jgi:hypothetical protein
MRLVGRIDTFLDDDVRELARLYTWLYNQDSLPTCIPIKCSLMTNLGLDLDLIDEFEYIIRSSASLEIYQEDTYLDIPES